MHVNAIAEEPNWWNQSNHAQFETPIKKIFDWQHQWRHKQISTEETKTNEIIGLKKT